MTEKQGKEVFPVRKIALEVLLEISEGQVFCDQAVHRALEKYPLERRDRGFLVRLAEGTIERQTELDYVLNQFSKVKVKKMRPVIREILRMAVYQILYMDQVPDSAACNEAVKLVQARKLFKLKGFVNGVLRNIARNTDKISYPDSDEPIKYLSVRYSMPDWIVKRFLDSYGREETEGILQSFLEGKGITSVRCNTSRFTVAEVQKSLEEQGVQVHPGKMFPFALGIEGYESLTELDAFRFGMIQVQDESSMVVGAVAGIGQGDTVLDVCAAPGGKSLHAADILGESGRVVSADLTKEKTEKIRENCERIGCKNIEITENDARVFRRDWENIADVVVADLPCSGLGVIGKKCDIKYKTKSEDVKELAKLQRSILQTVSRYVKPGGRLVYSTCTMAVEENQDNVEWIGNNLHFSPVSIEENLPEKLQKKTGKQGYIQITPADAGTDGFFVAVFEKRQE